MTGRSTSRPGPFLALLASSVAVLLVAADARAITYGEPACDGDGQCRYPNTVSLSGFRPPAPGEGVDGVAFGRCSGSLLSVDDDRLVILTAGHCSSGFLADLASGAIFTVGVSFDPVIARDLPDAPSRWSPAQYILGGLPVLPFDYGPNGNAFNVQFDYGVVIFEAGANPSCEDSETPWLTADCTPVYPQDIAPVTLPAEGFLASIQNVQDPPALTAVGYGVGEAHQPPGQGGRHGAPNDESKLGVRWVTTHGTSMLNFLGPDGNLVFGSQNPAHGNDGTCGGDSGGPLFYGSGSSEIQVAVTSSGDSMCRASALMARLDTPAALEFLDCVTTGTASEDIEACGCIEVDAHGVCGR